LVDELVNARDTRDGIPRELFPLRGEDLGYYKFSLKGETYMGGRRTYDILFEPVDTKDLCIHVGTDDKSPCHQWKGEAWMDAEDYQPSRIETQLAKGVPWGYKRTITLSMESTDFRKTDANSTIHYDPP
jgi:hypothetical protein